MIFKRRMIEEVVRMKDNDVKLKIINDYLL